MKPEAAIGFFNIEGAVEEIAPFGLGHINDTFLVKAGGKQYLLQKVNRRVFKYVDILEHNVHFVLQARPELFPFHFKTKEGRIHVVYDEDCWRLQAFYEDAYSPDQVGESQIVHSIGGGFGAFASAFAHIPAEEFKETIPNFHDLGSRIFQLEKAVQLNPVNRMEMVSELILNAFSYRWIAERFQKLVANGLPKRLCHNDAKAANILLHKRDNSFAKIIDLDTIGPGYLLYDYGDLMRSLFTPAPENELDPAKLIVRPEFFRILKEAYLKEITFDLDEIELSSLEFGGLYMTYLMGIRFLTDFIQGDVYYKTSFENENFIRARNQFRLLEHMERALSHNYQLEA